MDLLGAKPVARDRAKALSDSRERFSHHRSNSFNCTDGHSLVEKMVGGVAAMDAYPETARCFRAEANESQGILHLAVTEAFVWFSIFNMTFFRLNLQGLFRQQSIVENSV